eukprot:4751414-Amphidinium_carterae.1
MEVCKTFFADDELRARTKIDGVLTVVDAVHFQQQLRMGTARIQFLQCLRCCQVKAKVIAAYVVWIASLVEVDAVAAETIAEVETTIRSINEVDKLVSFTACEQRYLVIATWWTTCNCVKG